MKAILTVFVILLINAATVAQHTQNHDQVDAIEMDVVLVYSLPVSNGMEKTKMDTVDSLVRLYRHQNSRVKKALSFKTRKDRPKLA